MSDAAESKPTLDLSDLRLVPQWVAEFGKAQPRLESDDADNRPRDRRDGGGGDRRDRRGPPGPPNRDVNRRSFDKPSPGRSFDRDRDRGGPRGDQRGGERRDDRRGGGGGGRFRGRDDRGPGAPRFEPPPTVQGLQTSIEPDQHALEAMVQMIRTAGKAYSVFDAARLVLASGDRFHAKFALPPSSNAKLVHIPADGSVWLSRDEALAHLLHSDLLDHFYRVEEIELEEPKGNFTSVAVCGMSGELLGPPNHHSYQTTLHKMHRERFSHMFFEDYKRRVHTDNSPEAVQKWKDSQKHGTHWVDIVRPVPEGGEQERLKSRAEMEAHFRRHHAEGLITEAGEVVVAGNILKKNIAPGLYHGLRVAVDEARKHLLQTAQQLCTGFERLGLKLFKRRGGKLWVSRNRPRVLDSGLILSDRITKIVEVVKARTGISVKELIETVAPSPLKTAETPSAPAPAPEVSPPAAEVPAPPAEHEEPAPPAIAPSDAAISAESAAPAAPEEVATPQAAAAIDTSAQAPAAPAATPHELTAAQIQVLKDLHWLNSEGYIIEYADGVIFIGVTEPPPPKPKPVKPEAPKAEAPQAEAAAAEVAAPEEEAKPAEEEVPASVEPEAEAPPVVETEAPVEESAAATEDEAEKLPAAQALVVAAPVEIATATEP